MPSPLLKQRLEIVDQVIHKNNELLKRWDESLTTKNPRFIDRFISGDLWFFIRIWSKYSGEDWLAHFQKVPTAKSLAGKKMLAAYSEKETMLVNVIQLMQKPKRMIPALVRLESVNIFRLKSRSRA